MGFNEKYIQTFLHKARPICEIRNEESTSPIGMHLLCPYSPENIIQVMDIWVQGVEQLLQLVRSSRSIHDPRYRALYKERGITYDEYYYLFQDTLDEEKYGEIPAFIFTKIFSKDLRNRRFKDFEYTPESYKRYILSLHIVPTQYFNRSLEASISLPSLFAHSYCIAKTRSGKTELLKLFVYNLMKEKDDKTSLLILDPHGEFAREIRRLKLVQENLDRIVYLDPSIDSEHTPVFNPFEIKEKDTAKLAYTIDTILDAFHQLLRDQSITGNMKRLLRHCIYALLYHEGTTMLDLLTLLSGFGRNRNQKVPEFYPEEEKLMNLGKQAPDPLTRRFFEYGWKEVDSRTISAVSERIDGILSHPLVRRFVVGKNSFDLEQYLNTGKIVVVNLDFTKLGNIGSEAIGRLIVSEAQNISAQRNKLPKSQRPRTLIFMDECQRFVSAAIERALSEFAKFNTFLFLAHQYIEQIDDGMVKAMLSNTENKIVGRNSSATMGSIASDVGVSKEDLMDVKKYQFYIKTGDQDPFLFQSADFLLDHPGSEYYISEEEAKEKIDSHMISHYYHRIQPFVPPELKNGENVILGTQTSVVSVDLDDAEF